MRRHRRARSFKKQPTGFACFGSRRTRAFLARLPRVQQPSSAFGAKDGRGAHIAHIAEQNAPICVFAGKRASEQAIARHSACACLLCALAEEISCKSATQEISCESATRDLLCVCVRALSYKRSLMTDLQEISRERSQLWQSCAFGSYVRLLLSHMSLLSPSASAASASCSLPALQRHHGKITHTRQQQSSQTTVNESPPVDLWICRATHTHTYYWRIQLARDLSDACAAFSRLYNAQSIASVCHLQQAKTTTERAKTPIKTAATTTTTTPIISLAPEQANLCWLRTRTCSLQRATVD